MLLFIRVWRITVDIYDNGISKDFFCVDDKPSLISSKTK